MILRAAPAQAPLWTAKGLTTCSASLFRRTIRTRARKSKRPPRRPARPRLSLHYSLTEGYWDGGSRFAPYAPRLRDLLAGALPPGARVAVDERGRSGEYVVPDMEVSVVCAHVIVGSFWGGWRAASTRRVDAVAD